MNNVKTIEKAYREQYLRCPYCNSNNGGHGLRVSNSVGKYRVKLINDNVLSFICSKCGHTYKIIIEPKIYLWDKIKETEKEKFKLKYYKGGKNKNGKRI